MAPAKRTAKKAAKKTTRKAATKRTAKKATKRTAKKTARKASTKKTARKASATKADTPAFVYGSRIKDYVKSVSDSGGMRCPDDTIAAINAAVAQHVEAAVKRAEGNKRNTLRSVDL